MHTQPSGRAEWLQNQFDEVMRNPASARGMDIDETGRLLAEAARSPSAPGGYAELINEFEALYLEQFLRTCMTNPTFGPRIRVIMARYR